jgi:hypothetical protein
MLKKVVFVILTLSTILAKQSSFCMESKEKKSEQQNSPSPQKNTQQEAESVEQQIEEYRKRKQKEYEEEMRREEEEEKQKRQKECQAMFEISNIKDYLSKNNQQKNVSKSLNEFIKYLEQLYITEEINLDDKETYKKVLNNLYNYITTPKNSERKKIEKEYFYTIIDYIERYIEKPSEKQKGMLIHLFENIIITQETEHPKQLKEEREKYYDKILDTSNIMNVVHDTKYEYILGELIEFFECLKTIYVEEEIDLEEETCKEILNILHAYIVISENFSKEKSEQIRLFHNILRETKISEKHREMLIMLFYNISGQQPPQEQQFGNPENLSIKDEKDYDNNDDYSFSFDDDDDQNIDGEDDKNEDNKSSNIEEKREDLSKNNSQNNQE